MDRSTAVFHKLAARIYNAGSETAPSWQNQDGALVFKLSDMPNYTRWTAMYDAFRIKRAVVRFINGTAGGVNYTALDHQGTPQLFVVNDHDDASISTTFETDILSNSATRHKLLLNEYSHSIVPTAALRTYNDTNLTQVGYAEAAKNQWIDCDYPDVPHYGVKYMVPTTFGTGVLAPYAQIDIWVEVEIEFKGSKL